MMHVIEGSDGRPVLAFPSSRFVCAHTCEDGKGTQVVLEQPNNGETAHFYVDMPLSLFLKAANLEPKK